MINRIMVEIPITERDFSSAVEDLFKLFGWRFSHFRPARTEKGWRTAITGDRGFPDYVAVRNARLVFIELKSEKGRLTEAQAEWLELLRQCQRERLRHMEVPNIEVYLWKPSMFEEIVGVLT